METAEKITQAAKDEVVRAREALKAAEAEYNAAVEVERDVRYAYKMNEIQSAPESAFHSDIPNYTRDTYIAVWDKSDKMNALDPQTCQFGPEWLAGSTAVLYKRQDQARTRPTRIAVTSGQSVGGENTIGNITNLRDDQTQASKGYYQIVGLVFYGKDGEVIRAVGDVPNHKLSTASFK